MKRRLLAGLLVFLLLPSLPIKAQEDKKGMIITATHLSTQRAGVTVESYLGIENVVMMRENSVAAFEFNATAGEYAMEVIYAALPGKNMPIECEIKLNGMLPDTDFSNIIFPRIFCDSPVTADKNGNEYTPDGREVLEFQRFTLHSGKTINDVYKIALNEGKNTLSFIVLKEGMGISSIRLFPYVAPLKYKEYRKLHAQNAKEAKSIKVQGEKASAKSEISIYPLSDRTSPLNEPFSYSQIKINAIGGQNWKRLLQRVSWTITVKSSGYYTISIRNKQDFAEGATSFRRLYVDGSVPFEEANRIAFAYQQGWQLNRPDFSIYLSKGSHTITLENVYGDTYKVFTEVDDCIASLFELYRKMIMITGLNPDKNRDYNIEKQVPGLIKTLKENAYRLNQAKKELLKQTNSKGKAYSLIEMLEQQLSDFAAKPRTIPSRLSSLSTNISTLSSGILAQRDQPLMIDYIEFLPETKEKPEAETGFVNRLIFEIRSFITSFFYDYNSIQPTSGNEHQINLWLAGLTVGRDQANAMRMLIDTSFSQEMNIGVNIRLVDVNALLPAVATGGGPDVAIAQERTMPLNYGFRGAVYDLSRFSDYKEVLKCFPEAASAPFRYQESTYGLPDSFVWQMMFYRKDILSELNLQPPETWEQVFTLIPKLSAKFLTFGLPGIAQMNNDVFYTLLFQNKGSLYNSQGTAAELDSEQSVYAFTKWSEFYTKYSLQQTMDQFTRFRTGEAPIIIAPYTFYNQLKAAAPEIDGFWEMAPVPATVINGEINRTVSTTSTAAVIFQNAKDKESSWAFLKWWTSSETQQNYNMQMEILQGPAGRIAIATNDGLTRLPWSNKDISILTQQIKSTQGVPEVPGSYMAQRYINTAVLLSVNNNIAPRTAIVSYHKLINDEIKRKLSEFGIKE